MKKTPLNRGDKELRRRTELKRTGFRSREPGVQRPRAAVKAVRDTPRRRVAPRWTRAEWDEAQKVLLVRCRRIVNGREEACCEHCGDPLRGSGVRHHRKRRQFGGDRFANVVLLLPEHHDWIHAHPLFSRAEGWIVADEDDPAEWPMRLHGRDFVLLNDEGGWSRTA